MIRLLLITILLLFAPAPTLTIHAVSDRADAAPGGIVTITMSVSSPSGAHIELIKSDAYTFVSGGIDYGVCGFSGCLASPGTAVMTETIRIADNTPPGPLTLTAFASAADGSYVTTTVQLEIAPTLHLEADASRQEVQRGDVVTIDAYLFNDGAAPALATFDIVGPPGFELIDAPQESNSTTIAPGQAAHVRFVYRVLQVAPHARATFVVRGGWQTATVVVRVGPPPQKRVWMPIARA